MTIIMNGVKREMILSVILQSRLNARRDALFIRRERHYIFSLRHTKINSYFLARRERIRRSLFSPNGLD